MGMISDAPLRVEIDPQTLLRLLAGGQVCAADFRCLDGASKRCLWQLCLKSCAQTSADGGIDPLVSKQLCQACGQCAAGREESVATGPAAGASMGPARAWVQPAGRGLSRRG